MGNDLGRGGIGTVFKALDRYRCDLPEGNRHVAIKFLNKKTDGAQLLSNLRREFFCAQALAHPNIVKVYELELDGDAAFFTMELLEGELLSDLTARLGPTPIPRTMAWTTIREIGAALAHKGERKRAIEHHQMGINLIKDADPSLALVRLYEEAAWLYMLTGDNMLAIYASEKALR